MSRFYGSLSGSDSSCK